MTCSEEKLLVLSVECLRVALPAAAKRQGLEGPRSASHCGKHKKIQTTFKGTIKLLGKATKCQPPVVNLQKKAQLASLPIHSALLAYNLFPLIDAGNGFAAYAAYWIFSFLLCIQLLASFQSQSITF
eukprot:1143180-Pelagomonas_calceolata.AAC.3